MFHLHMISLICFLHSKGLHTASHWMTASVRAIQQRTRCGTGVHWMPLLFALAIEPLSCTLKQAMSGIHIHHIHVHQQAPRGVVAMCAHDTTIVGGGLDGIAHAKEANQCDMDTSSASINRLNTTWFLCGNMLLNPPPPDVIPGTMLGGKDETG